MRTVRLLTEGGISLTEGTPFMAPRNPSKDITPPPPLRTAAPANRMNHKQM